MMMQDLNRSSRSALFAIILMLGGCTVGPDYLRPDVETPVAFKEASDAPNTPWPIAWKEAEPLDGIDRGPWWAIFADPELDALVEQVNISNQNLIQAEAQYRQARAMVDAARSGYFPTVGASLGVTRGDSGGGGSVNRSVLNTRSNFDLSLSWEIDIWGKIRRTVEASEAEAEASAADLAVATLSAQATLVQSYFQLRILDAEHDLFIRTVDEYRRSLKLTQNQYAAGVAQRSDVTQAEAQLKAAEAQTFDVELQRSQLEHAIALLIGKAPANFTLPPMKNFTPALPVIPTAVPSQLLERRPDIASAERKMAAANANIGVARAAYFPTLSLSVGGGLQGNDTSNLLSMPVTSWSIAPLLAGVIFDGGARRAQSEAAQAAYDQMVAFYRQTVLSGFQEVEDNLAALRILAHEVEAQMIAAQQARLTVTLVDNQYRAGMVSYLNVVSAQTTALNNERAVLQVVGRQYDASVMLIKALGGGWQTAELVSGEEPM